MCNSHFGRSVCVGGSSIACADMSGVKAAAAANTPAAWLGVCAVQVAAGQLCVHMQREERAGGRPPTLPPALPLRGASSITRLGSLWMRASRQRALFSYFCPCALQASKKAPLKPEKHQRQETSGACEHQDVILPLSSEKRNPEGDA